RRKCCKQLRTNVAGHASERLLRQVHFEFDGGQLIRRLADFSKKAQPARILLQTGKHWFDRNIGQRRVLLYDRLLEEFEGTVDLTAPRKNQRNIVRPG